MSYKNFQSLNTAIKQAAVSPVVESTRRLFNQVESMTSMAKDLPTSWGRSYSGVMVLKYDQDGNPTDVTETQSFSHAIDVPDSLVSDVQRRFTEVYNQYAETCGVVNQGISVSSDLPLGAIKQTMLKPIPSGEMTALASFPLEPDLYFNIGADPVTGHKYGFSTEQLEIPDNVLSFGCKYVHQNAILIQFSSLYRISDKLLSFTGNVKINSISDTVQFDSSTSYFRVENASSITPIMFTHPLSVAPNPGWNTFSSSSSGVTNPVNSSSMDFSDLARTDIRVKFSDIITINSAAITNLKSAIDSL